MEMYVHWPMPWFCRALSRPRRYGAAEATVARHVIEFSGQEEEIWSLDGIPEISNLNILRARSDTPSGEQPAACSVDST